ncbi:MAG TPA: PQQ-binding-like beta-propeller repeat protein [Clostridia bacterium]|nr:PQQ-binding-like beta-propeller repeat protein [Clostridia bacterium]
MGLRSTAAGSEHTTVRHVNFLFSLVLACHAAAHINAAEWGQWRGPDLNGSSPERNLPSFWSKTNNVLWVTPLPGDSGATPVIWKDSVFVSSPDKDKNLLLICLDSQTGTEKWRRTASKGNQDKGRNNMASPSPVTDGKRVVVMFGTGALVAFDHDGNQLWSRDLAQEYGTFANMWIYGSSPLLFQDRLYIQVLQRNPVPSDYPATVGDKPERESFLLCLDPANGKNLWRQMRPTDAQGESQEAYSTPIPYAQDGSWQILVIGANALTANDAKTGAEIWRCAGLNPKQQPWWRVVPAPLVAGNNIIACGPRREPVFAIQPTGKGDLSSTAVKWQFKEFPSDCPTPLFYEGKLFLLDGDRQMMTCLEPDSGKVLWQGHLGLREAIRSSPTGADGKIYCVSESGTVVILGTGAEFKILATIHMGEPPIRSSIAVANGRLFIRTGKNLYCIGNSSTRPSNAAGSSGS